MAEKKKAELSDAGKRYRAMIEENNKKRGVYPHHEKESEGSVTESTMSPSSIRGIIIAVTISSVLLCLSVIACSNIATSCSREDPITDEERLEFAEKVLTPGTDEYEFARDYAEDQRKKNGKNY